MTTLYRHTKTGALVQTDERTTDSVRFYPQGGGGFSCVATAVDFDAQFESAMPPDFRSGTVSLETLPDIAFPCYSNGLRKNGYGIPWFDEAGVKRLIEAIEPHLAIGQPPCVKREGDSFTVYDPGEEEYSPCEVQTEVIGGTPTKLWQVGDGWCWRQVELEGHAIPDLGLTEEETGAPAP